MYSNLSAHAYWDGGHVLSIVPETSLVLNPEVGANKVCSFDQYHGGKGWHILSPRASLYR